MKIFLIVLLGFMCLQGQSQAWWEMDIAGHLGSGDNSNNFFKNDTRAFLHRDPAQRNREVNDNRGENQWQQGRRARKRIDALLQERINALKELASLIEGDTTLLLTCEKCNGAAFEPCPRCNTNGYVTCPMCEGAEVRTCRICEGVGVFNEQTCLSCQGTGKNICKTCNGVRKITCPVCEGSSGTNCARCHGTGFMVRQASAGKQ